MPNAAKLGDLHSGLTLPSITGSPNVIINALPANRQTDLWNPPPFPPIPCVVGSSTVFINGLAAARIGDNLADGSSVITGSPNVIIGG